MSARILHDLSEHASHQHGTQLPSLLAWPRQTTLLARSGTCKSRETVENLGSTEVQPLAVAPCYLAGLAIMEQGMRNAQLAGPEHARLTWLLPQIV